MFQQPNQQPCPKGHGAFSPRYVVLIRNCIRGLIPFKRPKGRGNKPLNTDKTTGGFTDRSGGRTGVLIFAAGIICLSCAFADLRPIGVSTVPGEALALLPDEDSPVRIRFDTDMEKRSVEKALQVYSPAGIVSGDFRWEETALNFIPASLWRPGIRYALKLSGTVSSIDGRELLLAADIPFYAISHSAPPYVLSFSPSDGASIEAGGSTGGVSRAPILEINFSQPMDCESTEAALKLDIPGKKIIEWISGGKTMRVSSDKALNAWTVYRWSISGKALSAEGAPLVKELSAFFVTDLDREFPELLKLLPLLPPGPTAENGGAETSPRNFSDDGNTGIWSAWTPAGLSLGQGTGFGQGIGVEFNKPIDAESLRRAFSFAPPLPGRVEILSPVSAVFIPSREPEPDTVYVLTISGSVKDREGLKMGADYKTVFKTDVPFLKIRSVAFGDAEEIIDPQSGATLRVKVNSGGIVGSVIHFSLPFDPEDYALLGENALGISLRPFFPETLASVGLRSARWTSPDGLTMSWEGMEAGSGDEPHYYRLTVPGGPNGLRNSGGSYLKEDLILYLEAQK